MSGKKKKIYEALVDGATDGLTEDALFDFVKKRHPKISGKSVIKASGLALRDKKMRDKTILQTIFSLAIKHRVEPREDAPAPDDIPVASVAKPVAARAEKTGRRSTARPSKAHATEETSSPD